MPKILPLGDIGWRARDRRAGDTRRGSATFVIVYEAQTRTGSRVLEGRRVEGERSREGQRFLSRLEATSPDTRGQYRPENKRAKALPGAYRRYFQTRHQPGFSWTPKATQDRFLRPAELVQVRQAPHPLPGAAAERRIRELTCLQ
ncbi:hypothetical protein PAL_GLEAN10015692 [Pteropus alecto]|uniref:Uncharacterized protein n=1 Tax=Pteropus alecto TaxID=9402 RepID=L5KK37_PTEAL|nr:hypothetical protein PAL_GLEAN10015692 [Pteropus alecto]